MRSSLIGKILLAIALILILCIAGCVYMLSANSDKILEQLTSKIEKSSGYPLHLEEMPKISFFPPSVELGKTEWGDRNGDIFVGLERGSAKIEMGGIFSGNVEINSLELEGLFVLLRQKPAKQAASTPAPQASPAPSEAAPQPQAQPSAEASRQDKALDALRGKLPHKIVLKDGALNFISNKNQSVELSALNALITSENDVAVLSQLSCTLLESQIRGKATLDLNPQSGGGILLNADILAPGLNLGQLARLLAGKDIVSGKGNLQANISMNPLNALPTLSGSGVLSTDAVILQESILPPKLAGLKEVTDNTRLNNSSFQWTMSNGVVELTSGVANGPGFSLSLAGKLDLLEQVMDLSGNVDISGLAVLPVTIKGPFKSPKYTVDQGNATDAVRQTLERHGVDVEDAVNKGLNRLFRR